MVGGQRALSRKRSRGYPKTMSEALSHSRESDGSSLPPIRGVRRSSPMPAETFLANLLQAPEGTHPSLRPAVFGGPETRTRWERRYRVGLFVTDTVVVCIAVALAQLCDSARLRSSSRRSPIRSRATRQRWPSCGSFCSQRSELGPAGSSVRASRNTGASSTHRSGRSASGAGTWFASADGELPHRCACHRQTT